MKRQILIPIALLLMLVSIPKVYAAMQYQIASHIFGAGGATSSNSTYRVMQAVGEPAIGQASNSSYQAKLGFWHTVSSNGLDPNILAIYVLAFDNPPKSKHNLTPYFNETLQGIVDNSREVLNKKAVVLADLEGIGDTQILLIENGETTTIPITNVLPSVADNEYDVTNGETLGTFLAWALNQYANGQTKTFFSYIGHGAPLMPESNMDAVLNSSNEARQNSQEDNLPPLPAYFGLHPEFTDEHATYNPDTGEYAASFISPYDLATALNQATNNGQNPIDVLDLVHCFAASIEELYEVSPYVRTITGSPNYIYYGTQMPGRVLAALEPSDSAQTLANKVITTYDTVISESDEEPSKHPRILVAIDSSKIAAIVEAWNNTATFLLTAFDQNYDQTRERITNTYLTSAKYDSTFYTLPDVPQDLALEPPDALSDMGSFASQLGAQFGEGSNVGNSASNTIQRINEAIITKVSKNGQPWFAEVEPRPTWDFDSHSGIALYTDFQGEQIDGKSYLSFQARWYTGSVFISPNGTGNPNPYAFAKDTLWDDTFLKFWEYELANGLLETVAEMPDLPPAIRDGEVSIAAITEHPTLMIGTPVTFAAEIKIDQPALNPQVSFSLSQDGVEVFTDSISTGYLVTGTYPISASKAWTPTTAGDFRLEVFIDSDGRIAEENEDNNKASITGQIELGYEPGNCNADAGISAADISALVLEIFNPGTFGPSCDANQDGGITAADISCTVLLIFNGPGACESGRSLGLVTVSNAQTILPKREISTTDDSITIPINLTANDHQISSLTASVDYDEELLTFDPTDSNNDGIPDAITLNLQPSFQASVMFDPTDRDGEIDFFIGDLFTPLDSLSDGNLATITFEINSPNTSVDGAVNYSNHPAPTIGDSSGQDIPLLITPGSLDLTASSAEETLFLPIIIQ